MQLAGRCILRLPIRGALPASRQGRRRFNIHALSPLQLQLDIGKIKAVGLNLTPVDIQERTLAIQNPKSGRPGETVYVPRKLLVRLNDYVKVNKVGLNDRIFPISYVAAWSMVKKAGNLVDIANYVHMI